MVGLRSLLDARGSFDHSSTQTDVNQTWPGNPAPSSIVPSPSSSGVVADVLHRRVHVDAPLRPGTVGTIQHSLANWRLISWASSLRVAGSVSERACSSRSLITGSLRRPKFSASAPSGDLCAEASAAKPFHQKFWLSTTDAGVVAPAERLELGCAEQGVGDQHRLLDRRAGSRRRRRSPSFCWR